MPYLTGYCVVIEPAVPFIGSLVQLEPFDHSSLKIKIVDGQKLVYEMYHEETIKHNVMPSPSIKHECSVKE